MPSTSASAPDVSSAFLNYLQQALEARHNGKAGQEAAHLDAAAQCFPLDDVSLETFYRGLLEQRRFSEAIRFAAIIAQLDPRRALHPFRLGHALQMANRHADAIGPYRAALAIDPRLPLLRNNLAAALQHCNGSVEEQTALLEAAVRDNPDESDAWINLTSLYRSTLNLTRALEAGEKAVRSAPHNALAHNNYSLTLREAQRGDEALHAAHTACTLAPGDAAMRSNLSMLHLIRGDYAAGWPLHEARWDGASELAGNRPAFPKPQWRGEPLAGKTLLLWGEQGMGDLLQFCRYVPVLAERVHREGGRLVWNSFPQMGALLARSLGGHADEFTSGGGVDSLPAYDFEVPMLSLPLLLDTREHTIPSATPYLHADPAAVKAWNGRLASETRLKVGLTWTGSHGHQRNPFRRVGWARYAKHFGGMGNVAFYSLQPGAADDLAAAKAAGLTIADYTAEFKTFDDTAAFVSALDLVITVCTSVAHLSGALGQRTWVLLDVSPHWVWLLDRADSPWYPTATLYRQPGFGEWEPVMNDLTRDLRALAARHA